MRWLAENWQWLLPSIALLLTAIGVSITVRRYRHETSDVDIRVAWNPEETPSPPHFNQKGTEAQPFKVHLIAMNLGGTTSPRGRVTITAGANYRTCDSKDWDRDQPNAALTGATVAHSCKLPKLGRNQRVALPPLRIVPASRRVEGGSRISRGTLRWEVWYGKQGGNSDDLKFKLTVRRPT